MTTVWVQVVEVPVVHVLEVQHEVVPEWCTEERRVRKQRGATGATRQPERRGYGKMQ